MPYIHIIFYTAASPFRGLYYYYYWTHTYASCPFRFLFKYYTTDRKREYLISSYSSFIFIIYTGATGLRFPWNILLSSARRRTSQKNASVKYYIASGFNPAAVFVSGTTLRTPDTRPIRYCFIIALQLGSGAKLNYPFYIYYV